MTETERAPADRMDITLAVRKSESGQFNLGFNVLVSGAPWAYAHREHHGMHGTSYDFHQICGDGTTHAITTPYDPPSKTGRMQQASVRGSTKRARRDGDNRSTEQRIIDKARELIAAGHLIDPAEDQRRADERRAERQRIAAEVEAGKCERFRAKAIEALGAKPYVGGKFSEDVEFQIARVIEAMEWAQSQ